MIKQGYIILDSPNECALFLQIFYYSSFTSLTFLYISNNKMTYLQQIMFLEGDWHLILKPRYITFPLLISLCPNCVVEYRYVNTIYFIPVVLKPSHFYVSTWLLTVYKWKQMDQLGFIWFHLYTVLQICMGQFRPS